ncbi:hypothetical protein [Verrucosispora sp. NA02020]|uniref:hypothetical protein n=1 Tax=Verrucosispora sp. NA02020 TaxID=2742132 RepID=UPI0015928DE2|nr:hypothetical protein [Verrucosispora sp. NA02020]QKW15440.1 hypothetical protein HUT12_23510 [Verrucosispora sp. NA02020]
MNPARDIADLAVLLAGEHDVPAGPYAADAAGPIEQAYRDGLITPDSGTRCGYRLTVAGETRLAELCPPDGR